MSPGGKWKRAFAVSQRSRRVYAIEMSGACEFRGFIVSTKRRWRLCSCSVDVLLVAMEEHVPQQPAHNPTADADIASDHAAVVEHLRFVDGGSMDTVDFSAESGFADLRRGIWWTDGGIAL